MRQTSLDSTEAFAENTPKLYHNPPPKCHRKCANRLGTSFLLRVTSYVIARTSANDVIGWKLLGIVSHCLKYALCLETIHCCDVAVEQHLLSAR